MLDQPQRSLTLDFYYVSHGQIVRRSECRGGSILGEVRISVLGQSWPSTRESGGGGGVGVGGVRAESLSRECGGQAQHRTSLALRGPKPSSTFL